MHSRIEEEATKEIIRIVSERIFTKLEKQIEDDEAWYFSVNEVARRTELSAIQVRIMFADHIVSPTTRGGRIPKRAIKEVMEANASKIEKAREKQQLLFKP